GLQNLKALRLGRNRLQTLPESFGGLKQLAYLVLSENQLSALPKSFGNLPNHLILRFEDNPLAGKLALLWLARSNSRQSWIPHSLFTHPLVLDLDPSSLHPLPQDSCPFCGTLGIVGGQEKKRGKNCIFCARCELRIS
ncbi:MAG: hypothetical protein ACFFBD_23175, partial [Candidatus Hodarchaeota archaeon]